MKNYDMELLKKRYRRLRDDHRALDFQVMLMMKLLPREIREEIELNVERYRSRAEATERLIHGHKARKGKASA